MSSNSSVRMSPLGSRGTMASTCFMPMFCPYLANVLNPLFCTPTALTPKRSVKPNSQRTKLRRSSDKAQQSREREIEREREGGRDEVSRTNSESELRVVSVVRTSNAILKLSNRGSVQNSWRLLLSGFKKRAAELRLPCRWQKPFLALKSPGTLTCTTGCMAMRRV